MTERADRAQSFQIAVRRQKVGAVHATGHRIGQVPTLRHCLPEIFVPEFQSLLAGLRFRQIRLRPLDNEGVFVWKITGHYQLAQVSEQAAEVRLLDAAQSWR